MTEPRWKGASGLAPFLVSLESLLQDPSNARRHGPRNLEAIQRSLSAFGQRKAIVVAGGVVFAGNGTLEAARGLEWTHLAAIDSSDLSAAELRAYSIADNQSGDLAEWDPEALAAALGPLPPALAAATGFNPDDLKAISLLGSQEKPAASESEGFATIKLTREQYTIVEGATAKLREQEGQPDMSVARAVELLSAEFLS